MGRKDTSSNSDTAVLKEDSTGRSSWAKFCHHNLVWETEIWAGNPYGQTQSCMAVWHLAPKKLDVRGWIRGQWVDFSNKSSSAWLYLCHMNSISCRWSCHTLGIILWLKRKSTDLNSPKYKMVSAQCSISSRPTWPIGQKQVFSIMLPTKGQAPLPPLAALHTHTVLEPSTN